MARDGHYFGIFDVGQCFTVALHCGSIGFHTLYNHEDVYVQYILL